MTITKVTGSKVSKRQDPRLEAALEQTLILCDEPYAFKSFDESGRVHAKRAPVGMFDQEDLYPHLITGLYGEKVAVPLGSPGKGFNRGYRRPAFKCQRLPHTPFSLGWWFPITRISLSTGGASPGRDGLIKVFPQGVMELCCTGPDGLPASVYLPGSPTHEPEGGTYRKWKIFVAIGDDEERIMVTYDGDNFEHWPES